MPATFSVVSARRAALPRRSAWSAFRDVLPVINLKVHHVASGRAASPQAPVAHMCLNRVRTMRCSRTCSWWAVLVTSLQDVHV